jgi:hypothetical protein
MRVVMPTRTEPAEVERALRRTETGWFLGREGQYELIGEIATQIDEFINEYKKRYNLTPDPFGLLDENPNKAAAFFELYTNPPISMDMRIAVWELINGADIEFIQFTYARDQEASLVIRLITPHQPAAIEYTGSTLRDFKVTRHFGTLSVGGQEIFDGYYAFNPSN